MDFDKSVDDLKKFESKFNEWENGFFASVQEGYKKYGSLTQGQFNSFEKMVKKYVLGENPQFQKQTPAEYIKKAFESLEKNTSDQELKKELQALKLKYEGIPF